MKKYLITGGAGFIGANLIRTLVKKSNTIIHIIEPPGANFWRLEDLKDKVQVHEINLINFAAINELVSSIKPDIIFHLASYGGLPTQKDQFMIYQVNLMGTVNLINACKSIGFECFVNTGSSSEYGKKEISMKEEDVLEPNSDYGVAKAAATQFCYKEALMNKLPIYTIRPFSVYGDYEAPTRLIPTVINKFLTKKPLQLSNPNNVRDFIYIDDMVAMYLAVAHKKPNSTFVFNAGTGVQSSIKDVVQTVQTITQKTIEIQWQASTPRPWEPKAWQANTEIAVKNLAWSPNYDLLKGLKKTVAWFTKHAHLYEEKSDAPTKSKKQRSATA